MCLGFSFIPNKKAVGDHQDWRIDCQFVFVRKLVLEQVIETPRIIQKFPGDDHARACDAMFFNLLKQGTSAGSVSSMSGAASD